VHSRCNKCGPYSERLTPPLIEQETPIFKHLNGLGTNKNFGLDSLQDMKSRTVIYYTWKRNSVYQRDDRDRNDISPIMVGDYEIF
jgi:hypothetical protein